MKIGSNPPLLYNYRELLCHSGESSTTCANDNRAEVVMEEEWELPLIDVGGLRSGGGEEERKACATAIVEASSKWGFFQVVNHGISLDLLRKMRREQVKLFKAPFEKKASCGLFNHSYRWGTPTATCSKQFSWSEAFHIPVSKIPEEACYGEFGTSIREVMVEYASAMQGLARAVAGVLVQNLGQPKRVLFEENCSESTCFLRLNHYPACPISSEVLGLVPHTDTSFLTILHQDDQVGGFQLVKDSNWVPVKPLHNTLIINIGDLFQAWSNDVYKSVEHRVIADKEVERHSIAYFLCPSQDSIIGSCRQPSIYRNFTFGEYTQQTQQDVKMSGGKVGLSRFLL